MRNFFANRRDFLISLAGAGLLRGQQNTVFTTDVKVVGVLATVRTRQGGIVRDLTKGDFLLAEDGRPQTIRYFSRETDLPLTLGLMVDTSMSQRRVMDAERGASMRFFDRVLRETKDQAFLLQFDMAIVMRQALTSSVGKLADALALVDTPSLQELGMQGGRGGTLLYDAVVMASKQIMKNQRGRKALIVLSDGVDFGSEASLLDAIEAAQRADALVYSILFSDAGAYRIPLGFRSLSLGGPDGRGALARLSRETGGSFFEVTKKLQLDPVFDLIQEELRGQYSLGYVSDLPVRISEFRKIQLTTTHKGLAVQARGRYWAQR
ncbi:MAG: VWA domain-containing protein [Bryobacteraceae bacterium]